MRVDLSRIDTKNLIKELPIWSVISFIIVYFGFVGFYTYCAGNNIPFVIPKIQLIIGVGIYISIFYVSLFIMQFSIWWSKADKALIIFMFFKLILIDPILIGIISLIFIVIYSEGYWEKKWKFKPLNKKENKDVVKYGSIALEIMGWITVVVLTYFNTPFNLWQFFVIYVLLYEAQRIKEKKEIGIPMLIIGFLIIPIFISYSFISNSSFSLIGLYSSKAKLIYENHQLEGHLIFRDGDYIYFKPNMESDSTYILNSKDISKILVLKKEEKDKEKRKIDSNSNKKIPFINNKQNDSTLIDTQLILQN